MGIREDRAFCAHCDTPQDVIWDRDAHGVMICTCRVCGVTFRWSDSLKDQQAHSLRTCAEIAAKLPRGDEG